MKIDYDKIIFANGKELYAMTGVIGIDNALEITYGYDGGIYKHGDYPDVDDPECMTEEERIELADHMIATWERFKKLGAKTREEYCEN